MPPLARLSLSSAERKVHFALGAHCQVLGFVWRCACLLLASFAQCPQQKHHSCKELVFIAGSGVVGRPLDTVALSPSPALLSFLVMEWPRRFWAGRELGCRCQEM